LAIFAAIRRASARVNNFAADLRFILEIDISKLLPVGVTHDEAVGRDFGSPRGRESGVVSRSLSQ